MNQDNDKPSLLDDGSVLPIFLIAAGLIGGGLLFAWLTGKVF